MNKMQTLCEGHSLMNVENVINKFVVAAKGKGWTVTIRNNTAVQLNNLITKRYPNIPSDYLEFLFRIDPCFNRNEDAWFFCESDYNQEPDENTWLWNSYEKISLESSENDQELIEAVKEFWDHHFPIAYAVHSDLAYLALSLSPENFGKVIYGFGPTFEESPETICDSFGEYLEKLTRILLDEENYEKTNQWGGTYTEREYADFV